jgi:hypothetical protein
MAGFTAQYLNIWPLQEVATPAIAPAAWLACLSTVDGFADLRDRLAVCFDIAKSGQSATLYGAAEQPDGRVRIALLGEWSGGGSGDQAVRELPALVAQIKPRAFGTLPGGPAAAVMSKLGAEHLAGWPASVPREEIRGELPRVAMGFGRLVDARRIARDKEPLLDGQVALAEKLVRGDTWVFSRKGQGDCDAVYAAAGAAHLAVGLKPSAGKLRVLKPRRRDRQAA